MTVGEGLDDSRTQSTSPFYTECVSASYVFPPSSLRSPILSFHPPFAHPLPLKPTWQPLRFDAVAARNGLAPVASPNTSAKLKRNAVRMHLGYHKFNSHHRQFNLWQWNHHLAMYKVSLA